MTLDIGKFFKEAARPEKMCEAGVDILTEDLKVPGSIRRHRDAHTLAENEQRARKI